VETATRTPADRHEARWNRAAALLDAASAAVDAGRLDEALGLARRSAQSLARVVGVDHPDHASAQLTIGRILTAQGRPRAALPHLERAAASFAQIHVDDPVVGERTAQALLAHAHCLQELGRFDEGRVHARAALEIARRRGGENAVLVASTHNQIAVLGKFSGRFQEAERHYLAALPVMRRRCGAVSREVATILHNLGGLEHARGRFARGEPYARRSVEIARALLPPRDPERLAHEVAHAGLLDGLGRHAEALAIYRRALAGFTRRYGRDHYEVGSTLHNLASSEHALGRIAAAQHHYEAAIAVLAKVRGHDHPDVALSRFNLAILHRSSGRIARARMLLRRASIVFHARLGAAHAHTRACAAALAAFR